MSLKRSASLPFDNNYKRKRQKVSGKRISKPKIKTKECLICMNSIKEDDIINIHLNHFEMCSECLIEQSKALLRNRDLLPWKCAHCKEELALDILKPLMNDDDYNKLLERQIEKIVGNTVSCSNCDSTFCVPSNFNNTSINCDICNTNIQIKQEFENSNNQNTLIELANQEGWAQCPGCHELIEKIDGCNSMTHHENDGSVTHFCYQCNDILDQDDVDTQGRDHFPSGSYSNCINHQNAEISPNINIDNLHLPDSINDLFDNDLSYGNIFNDIDFSNFNWNLNNDSSESDDNESEELYYCTECDYYGYNDDALQQHINAKDHQEIFHCLECNYFGYSQHALNQHQYAKNH